MKTRILIIGGGIFGISTAAELARRGINDILLVDQLHELGREETASSAAMLCFNNDSFVGPAHDSMSRFYQVQNNFGFDPEISKCGSILISTNMDLTGTMMNWSENQNEWGIQSIVLPNDKIEEILPGLRKEGMVGIYHGKDGYVDPIHLTEGFRKYAEGHGVKVWTHKRIEHVTDDGLYTKDGDEIHAENVIIAAGRESPELAEKFGCGHPSFHFSRRTLWDVKTATPYEGPYLDFIESGWYVRPTDTGVLVGVGDTINTASYPDPNIIIPPWGKKETLTFLDRLGIIPVNLNGMTAVRTMMDRDTPYCGPLFSDTGHKNIIMASGGSGLGITLSQYIAGETANLIEGSLREEGRRNGIETDLFKRGIEG